VGGRRFLAGYNSIIFLDDYGIITSQKPLQPSIIDEWHVNTRNTPPPPTPPERPLCELLIQISECWGGIKDQKPKRASKKANIGIKLPMYLCMKWGLGL